MKTACIAAAAALFTLCSCGKPPAPTPVAEVSPASPSPTATGKWEVHRGKAVDTLDLTDVGGVLRGELTVDRQWGGSKCPVNGTRVGDKIEFSYSDTSKHSDGGESSTDYSFKGTLSGGEIGGSMGVSMINKFKSGNATPASDNFLVVAKRIADR